MNLKTKTILFQGKNIPLSVSLDNKECFLRIDAFGGQDYQVEFSVDLPQSFDEQNWEHLLDLLAFFDKNLPQYLERSFHALPIFAENNHDDAGKYIVSFSGKLLSGIRRTIY